MECIIYWYYYVMKGTRVLWRSDLLWLTEKIYKVNLILEHAQVLQANDKNRENPTMGQANHHQLLGSYMILKSWAAKFSKIVLDYIWRKKNKIKISLLKREKHHCRTIPNNLCKQPPSERMTMFYTLYVCCLTYQRTWHEQNRVEDDDSKVDKKLTLL